MTGKGGGMGRQARWKVATRRARANVRFADGVEYPAAREVPETLEEQPEPQLPEPRVPRQQVMERDDEGGRPFVRPYVITRGRTKAAYHLAMETMVSSKPGGAPDESPEFRLVRRLCGVPRSVAEIAAMLRLPLGVAQIILGDMAALGLVYVHSTPTAGGRPAAALMERVLAGLRRL